MAGSRPSPNALQSGGMNKVYDSVSPHLHQYLMLQDSLFFCQYDECKMKFHLILIFLAGNGIENLFRYLLTSKIFLSLNCVYSCLFFFLIVSLFFVTASLEFSVFMHTDYLLIVCVSVIFSHYMDWIFTLLMICL